MWTRAQAGEKEVEEGREKQREMGAGRRRPEQVCWWHLSRTALNRTHRCSLSGSVGSSGEVDLKCWGNVLDHGASEADPRGHRVI